ncbi:uncharacterized protein AB9X84_026725 [Acanthopagrus schlegelii]
MCDTGQAMRGGIHLLLLAVSVLLARCQQKPQVSVSPTLNEIFSGDLFYLSCDNSLSGSTVKWYFNGTEQAVETKTWRVASATPDQSGSYQCEISGQKSDMKDIIINAYIPRALLTIKTGHPVMKHGSAVVLNLYNDNRLSGWNCWVYRGNQTRKIVLIANNDVSLDFQPRRLEVPETIFWCTDRNQQIRSNQITVWTSDKEVLLEMYHLPAVAGERLTLRCLVSGTNRISHTTFYKDDATIQESADPTYTIPTVTESAKGRYKCHATFTYKDSTVGDPYSLASDNQEVFVQVASMKAALSHNVGLSCSCPLCPSDTSYHWYYKDDDDDVGQPSHLTQSSGGFMMPRTSGTYACRAVWDKGMSLLSNSYVYKPPIKIILVFVVIGLLILFLACGLAVYLWYKKRSATGPVYEDVALRTRDKGDDKYEVLPGGAGREAEYDTLHPEATGKERKGEYEALKKEGMKGEVYHTLGGEGAAGGAGGYEALKKEGMKEGVYHTLGEEGAAGGAGGYEALKKEGMKEGVYHTLGEEGAAGGAGGYEALKKEEMRAEVYHTLGEGEAAGGAGGYEALKKEGMKEGVYHTLGGEGAGGGE